MRRISLTVMVLALVAGAIALVFSRETRSARSLLDTPSTSPASPTERHADLEPERATRLEVAPLAPSEAELPATQPVVDGEPEESPQASGVGRIEGMVLDESAQPVPRQPLKFIHQAPRPSVSNVYSSRAGEYAIEKAPAGTWKVFVVQRQRVLGQRSQESLGTIEVREGETTRFDVHLYKKRQISGGVVFREGEGATLVLEVFAERDPEHILRTTSTVNNLKKEKVFLSGEFDEGEEHVPHIRPGTFIFEGLEPDIYVVRIYMEPDHHPDLYIDERADLTFSDAELPFRELKIKDFVVIKNKRDRLEGKTR